MVINIELMPTTTDINLDSVSSEDQINLDSVGQVTSHYHDDLYYRKAVVDEKLTDLHTTVTGEIEEAYEELDELKADKTTVNAHINDKENPHEVTKAQVGLGNVDNTSDLNKPISTATQAALDTKQPTIADLATIRAGAALGATALQPGDNVSELVNDAGYITEHQSLAEYRKAADQDVIDATKVDKVAGKGLSTNDYDNTEKGNVAANTTARHSHTNKDLLDTYNQTNANISDAVTKKHEHSNKDLLDSYDQSNANITSAVNQKHSHSNKDLLDTYTNSNQNITQAITDDHTHTNKAILDTITESVVTQTHTHENKDLLDTYEQTETDLADAVDKKHSHSNKELLDTYDQTNANISDAVGKKHEHDNKALLDTYTQTNTNIADAVTKKHEHSNKAALDTVTADTVTKAASALQKSDVVDNVTTSTTDVPLSANMGKNLQDQITHLQSIGRFLSVWNCTTGKPETEPTTTPYTYKTGDYFRVGTIGTTNYKPTGSTYTGTASTTVETGTVKVGYVYYYDGTSWNLQAAGATNFDELTGRPSYNGTTMTSSTNIPEVKTSTWDGKQDAISDLSTIRSGAAAGATALQSGNNVSELTNDAGYLTSHQSLTNYYTKSETDSAISGHHDSTKEDTGKITISGTAYTAAKHTLSWTNNGTTYSYEVVTV